MPSRARLDEFIAVVESGDHAGAIERYYTEDASMQENAAPPRVGRDLLVAQERATLATGRERGLDLRRSRCSRATASRSTGSSTSPIHSGKTARIDEVALQEWRGDRIFRERFFYDPPKPKT